MGLHNLIENVKGYPLNLKRLELNNSTFFLKAFINLLVDSLKQFLLLNQI